MSLLIPPLHRRFSSSTNLVHKLSTLASGENIKQPGKLRKAPNQPIPLPASEAQGNQGNRTLGKKTSANSTGSNKVSSLVPFVQLSRIDSR